MTNNWTASTITSAMKLTRYDTRFLDKRLTAEGFEKIQIISLDCLVRYQEGLDYVKTRVHGYPCIQRTPLSKIESDTYVRIVYDTKELCIIPSNPPRSQKSLHAALSSIERILDDETTISFS